MAAYVGAIDQGTTSTRFILFDRDGRVAALDQREHAQITPRPGWVEHDAGEIWQRTREVIGGALASADIEAGEIAAIGITNQRETTVIWDRRTGEPIHHAIVWQDTRTAALVRELAGDAGVDRLRDRVGLPLSTYFSGPKVTWLLDHVPRRARASRERRAGLRHDGQLGAVEPHRWPQRRRARHRRDERQPHDAHGSTDTRLARAEPGAHGHPPRAAAGDPFLEPDPR